MSIFELFLLAVGLSMDAFAVSICKGLSMSRISLKKMIITGLWFGGFQALMPLTGYFLGSAFEKYIADFDHWTAFIFLSFIGINMIRESFSKDNQVDSSLGFKIMLAMAVATSIDALAVGITFGLLPDVNIIFAVSFIGIVTFIFSAVGVKIGNSFGMKYRSKAEISGGIILILIGTKILIEHLGIM
ncbi:MAG: manganese efflux pump MntP family protein [Ruminococcus sp.]|nr:manganese efflux pump MntP family protein [Oscillospiraceae bacterium]MDY4414594.1 manganese efflux pump MntP family protein [Ruminococcus sp.]